MRAISRGTVTVPAASPSISGFFLYGGLPCSQLAAVRLPDISCGLLRSDEEERDVTSEDAAPASRMPALLCAHKAGPTIERSVPLVLFSVVHYRQAPNSLDRGRHHPPVRIPSPSIGVACLYSLFARLRGRAGGVQEDIARAREDGSHFSATCYVVHARVASVRHYTLAVPIRLRGGGGGRWRARAKCRLSWNAEGSYFSALLSLTSILGPRSHSLVSVPPQLRSFPGWATTSRLLIHFISSHRPIAPSPLPAPPCPAVPGAFTRVLIHTICAFDPIPQIMRSRAPGDGVPRTWAPRVRTLRAVLPWARWVQKNRMKSRWSARSVHGSQCLAVLRCSVDLLSGRKAYLGEEERETEDARRCGLAPLSVSSAASEAVEAAAEGTRAQLYSQWLGFAFGQPGRHEGTDSASKSSDDGEAARMLRVGATRQHLIETETELQLRVGRFDLFWVVRQQRVADVESRRALWPRQAEGAWCGGSSMNSVSFEVERTHAFPAVASAHWSLITGAFLPASSAALLAFIEMALSIRALDAHIPVPPTGNVSPGRRWRSWQRWIAFHRRLCEKGRTHAVFVALCYSLPSLLNSSLAALLGHHRRVFVLSSSPLHTTALRGLKHLVKKTLNDIGSGDNEQLAD
ncbi:hypothetical protein B0H14DRAFT_3884207 [Mycena olivaceomarginata]|nr:hypothetical protein B0H14DRAFT_3884207 [Mycena olivaceomarginata]